MMMILLTVIALLHCRAHAAEDRPNVVIVMIDDMGYGDLRCHGSPFIPTPHLDGLHASSVRLTNFHVAPMCSPTRGQLLTGLDAMRNGSTIVSSSRMMVRTDAPMLPAHLATAGYATGHFGKWHLGENHPHRPQDRGFQETIWFPLQEISSLSDHWGNDYFDPVFRRADGTEQRFEGYCTDVLFEQALQWMSQQHQLKRPFLCYLPLNVVHGPQWAPADLRRAIAEQFPKLQPGKIGYLAMLANADTNVGRLEDFLKQTGLRDNTIVVFLSDNGGYALIGEYNAGMRDGKSRLAEGGHRVPCFVRWPKVSIGGSAGRDLDGLTQVQDLLPTILDLCKVERQPGPAFDGISLAEPLRGVAPVPERTLVVQYGEPKPFHMTCVMNGPWRLLSDIKGAAKGDKELYNLTGDPKQKKNLVDRHPDKVAELTAAYDRWWAGVEPQTRERATISLGHPAQPKVTLNSAEWRSGAMGGMTNLRKGVKRRGVWDVNICEAGLYQVELRRWPEESGLALAAAAPAWTPRDTSTPDHAGFPPAEALPIANAKLRVGTAEEESAVDGKSSAAEFQVRLPAGPAELEATFQDADGKHLCSAFFVTVKRAGVKGKSQK